MKPRITRCCQKIQIQNLAEFQVIEQNYSEKVTTADHLSLMMGKYFVHVFGSKVVSFVTAMSSV